MGLRISSKGWAYGVAVDTETTGLGASARIVQLAALRFRCRWNRPLARLDIEFSDTYRLGTLVKPPPGTRFDPGAVRVTGIAEAHVREAPSFPAIAGRFLEVVADLPVVAHNAPFDRRMISGEFEAMRMQPPAVTWICSMQAARASGHRRASLGDVSASLRIRPTGDLHDATVDAELAARVYGTLVRPGVEAPDLVPAPVSMPLDQRPFPAMAGWGMPR